MTTLQEQQFTPYKFAGKHGYYNDVSTGMLLLGRRYYLPKIGRFLTQDPLGHEAGLNLYQYASNSPLTNVDPDGLQQRDLTRRERTQVQAAIKFIRATGYADAADELGNLLGLGLIRVDEGGDFHGNYQTNAFAHNVLWVGPTLIPNTSNMKMYDPAVSAKRLALFEDNAWLASVLYHEYIHGEQFITYKFYSGLWEGVFDVNFAERGAYANQLSFLRSVHSQRRRPGEQAKTQGLIERTRLMRSDY